MHARIISVENSTLDHPEVSSDSLLHSRWFKRRQPVETCLLPQTKRFGFESAEIFPAITPETFTFDPASVTIFYKDITLRCGVGTMIGNFMSNYVLWKLCVSRAVNEAVTPHWASKGVWAYQIPRMPGTSKAPLVLEAAGIQFPRKP